MTYLKPEDSGKKQYNSYLKFSGLAFQLIATVCLLAYLGYQADAYLNFKFPILTIVLTMGGLASNLYLVFKQLNREP